MERWGNQPVAEFPSPCGELVMKPGNRLWPFRFLPKLFVSVPLRGIGYETAEQKTADLIAEAHAKVSVPLRGIGYETTGRWW